MTHYLLASLLLASVLLVAASECVIAYGPRRIRPAANNVSAYVVAWWIITGTVYLLQWYTGVGL